MICNFNPKNKRKQYHSFQPSNTALLWSVFGLFAYLSCPRNWWLVQTIVGWGRSRAGTELTPLLNTIGIAQTSFNWSLRIMVSSLAYILFVSWTSCLIRQHICDKTKQKIIFNLFWFVFQNRINHKKIYFPLALAVQAGTAKKTSLS